MATAEPGVHAARASSPAARPGGTPARVAGAAGPPSGRRGSGVPRLGERTPAAVEKRGPYMVTRAPSIQAKLQKHRDLAKAVLRRKGMLGASPKRPDSSGKRSVKFNKGYTALSQSPDENLVSLDSDSAHPSFLGAPRVCSTWLIKSGKIPGRVSPTRWPAPQPTTHLAERS
uniref:Family with sequence similarity 219 member B n=1 Tax=Equus caballus TaxID=9796 RepID=A0A9L0R883_HORSE